jgi:hypothetical protein
MDRKDVHWLKKTGYRAGLRNRHRSGVLLRPASAREIDAADSVSENRAAIVEANAARSRYELVPANRATLLPRVAFSHCTSRSLKRAIHARKSFRLRSNRTY